MSISVKVSGTFDKTISFLKAFDHGKIFGIMDKYGQIGVGLLKSATPRETGETAGDWGYEVIHTRAGKHILWFTNSHEEEGVNIAIILQYGHGTGTGGYVQGVDYINPAIQPVFDKLAEELWREVASA